MHKIETELQKATGVKPKKGEKRGAYLDRLADEADKLPDAKFKKLSSAAAKWVNDVNEAAEAAKDRGADFDAAKYDFEDGESEKGAAAEAKAEETDEDGTATDAADDGGDAEDEEEEDVAQAKKGKAAPKKAAGKSTKAKVQEKLAAKKAAAKANGSANKKIGVMAEIKRMLQRKEGATVREVAESLTRKFPDRKEKTMVASTRWFISVGSLRSLGKKPKKTEDETRGRVFSLPASL